MMSITTLKVADKRLVRALSEKVCEMLDQEPLEISMPALAEVVAISCELADPGNPEAALSELCWRARESGFMQAGWVRAAPKPDSVTPFKRPESEGHDG